MRRDSNGDDIPEPAAGEPPAGGQEDRDSNGEQELLVQAAGQNQSEPVAKAAGASADDRWQLILQGLTASLTQAFDHGRPKSHPAAGPKPVDQLQPMPLKVKVDIETPSK